MQPLDWVLGLCPSFPPSSAAGGGLSNVHGQTTTTKLNDKISASMDNSWAVMTAKRFQHREALPVRQPSAIDELVIVLLRTGVKLVAFLPPIGSVLLALSATCASQSALPLAAPPD